MVEIKNEAIFGTSLFANKEGERDRGTERDRGRDRERDREEGEREKRE